MRKNTFKTNETDKTYQEGWNTGYDEGYDDGYSNAEKAETVKEKCGIGAAMVAATSVCVGLAAIGGARLYNRFRNMKSKRYDDESEHTSIDENNIHENDKVLIESGYKEVSPTPLDDSASNTFCKEHKKAMKQLEKDPRFSGEEFEKKVSSLQDELRKLVSDLRIREDESRKRCNSKDLIAFAQGVNEILEENDNGLTEDDKAELRNIMDQINDKIQPSSDPEVPEILKPFQDDDDSKSDTTSDPESPNPSGDEVGDSGNSLYEVFDTHYNLIVETYQKLRDADCLDSETRSKYTDIIDKNVNEIIEILRDNVDMNIIYKERIAYIADIVQYTLSIRLDDVDNIDKRLKENESHIVEEKDDETLDESISESAATSEEKPVDPRSIEKVNQKFSSGEDKQKGGKRKKSKGQRR